MCEELFVRFRTRTDTIAQLTDFSSVQFSKRIGLYYQAGFGTQGVKIIRQRYPKREAKTRSNNFGKCGRENMRRDKTW